MRIIYVLKDGRIIKMPIEQVTLTCTKPCLDPVALMFLSDWSNTEEVVPEYDLEWLEELWKLEDKRGNN
jgi:hypothetical protein